MELNSLQHTILIVEDNPDDAELALIALKQKGIKTPCRIARNADEALDMVLGGGCSVSDRVIDGSAAAQALAPALVLLDLKLPGKSGLEVLKGLRAAPHTRYVPVVVLTTSVLEEDMIQSYEHGANSFIRKPVDFSTFLHEIELICHYWLETNLQPKKSPI
jgi:two-component system response regulator